MSFDYKIQFDEDNKLKHFLNIELLNENHINEILAINLKILKVKPLLVFFLNQVPELKQHLN